MTASVDIRVPQNGEYAAVFPVGENLRSWLIYAMVATLISCVYFAHIIDHPIDIDDGGYLSTAAQMADDFLIFLDPANSFGRPIVQILIWMSFALFGENTIPLHLMGMGLHTLAGILLALACWRLGLNMEMSITAGLLFLINTAHFRAVFWISAMAYPLALSCSLLGLLCCLNMLRNYQAPWIGGTYCFLLLGTLGHVVAFAMWCFCLCLAWLGRYDRKKATIYLAPLGLLLLVTVYFLVSVYPGSPQVVQSARRPEVYDLVSNFIWFVSRLATTAHWLPFSLYQFHQWELAVGVALIILLAWTVWKGDPRLKLFALWLALSILPFVTMSPAFVEAQASGPSRYLYYPSAASSVLFAYALYRGGLCISDRFGLWAGRGLIATILIALFGSSFFYLRQAEAAAHYTEGRNFIASAQIVKGVERLQEALATGSPQVIDRREIYARLVMLYPLLGKDALQIAQQGVREFPSNIELAMFLAVLEQDDDDASLRDLGLRRGEMVRVHMGSEAYLYDFNLAVLYNNLSKGYAMRGLHEKAKRAMERSLELQAGVPELFDQALGDND